VEYVAHHTPNNQFVSVPDLQRREGWVLGHQSNNTGLSVQPLNGKVLVDEGNYYVVVPGLYRSVNDQNITGIYASINHAIPPYPHEEGTGGIFN
jgi:hypothetical protein